MRARQLRLRKAYRPAHHPRDFFVGVSLDIVQPHHRSGDFGQALKCRFEIHAQPVVGAGALILGDVGDGETVVGTWKKRRPVVE